MARGLIAGLVVTIAAAVFVLRSGVRHDATPPGDAPLQTPGIVSNRAAPNVLLITLDTTRADRLGCYGYESAHTPALDELAARGTLFEQVFTSCPMTLPAHATLFTGRDPPEHGVRVNGKSRLGESIPTLAEILARQGYRTGAFVAAFVVNRKFGLARGFETYDDDLTGAHEQEVPERLSVYRPGDLVVDAALRWLGEVTGEPAGDRRPPFFTWVHLYDPHYPYHPHRELTGTAFADDGSYDAEVAFMDLQVGRLLRFLDERQLMASTLVIAVADHGEGLEGHGEVEHAYLLNEEVLRVPLIVSMPGVVREAQRVEAMVTVADVFPTILDLVGIEAPARGRARSLAGALRGETIPSVPSYAETDLPYTIFGWSPQRSVTTPRWKYVRTPRPELFDRTADPRELFNLASARPRRLEELESRLAEIEASMTPVTAPDVRLDAADRRRLESLGYVTAGGRSAAPPDDGRSLRDMKDMLPTKALSARLRRGLATGTMDDEEILEVARQLVAESPETASFHQHLGTVLMRTDQVAEALTHFRQAVELDPESAEARYDLGNALERQGKRDTAEQYFAEALHLDPDFAPAHVGMGNVLADRGHLDVAAGHYAEALRLRPGYPEAHYNLANVLARRGKVGLALDHHMKALEGRPDFALGHYALANLLRELGRLEEAILHYRELIRLEPENIHAHNNLGVALAESGKPEEAKAHYREALRIAPDFARPHTNLGNLASERGEYAIAIEHYATVVRLRPHAAEPARRLAWVLATCPDAGLRDGARAVRLAEQAAQRTQRRNALVLDTLAAAYAEAGRFDDALAAANEALRVAKARRREQLAVEIERRIDMYTVAQPFHVGDRLTGPAS